MSPRRPDLPPLRREALPAEPLEQLRDWYRRAGDEAALEQAMTLATVDADGVPDARTVLLKGFDERGLRFFTNLESAKAAQLRACPRAAAVLYWRELDRQVRIRGSVDPLPDAESDEYFAERPRDSQLGAWASPQSRAVDDRAELEAALHEAEARFEDAAVPRPPFWGGYRLRPDSFEFWQGREGRLHDRFLYTRTEDGWRVERLAP